MKKLRTLNPQIKTKYTHSWLFAISNYIYLKYHEDFTRRLKKGSLSTPLAKLCWWIHPRMCLSSYTPLDNDLILQSSETAKWMSRKKKFTSSKNLSVEYKKSANSASSYKAYGPLVWITSSKATPYPFPPTDYALRRGCKNFRMRFVTPLTGKKPLHATGFLSHFIFSELLSTALFGYFVVVENFALMFVRLKILILLYKVVNFFCL